MEQHESSEYPSTEVRELLTSIRTDGPAIFYSSEELVEFCEYCLHNDLINDAKTLLKYGLGIYPHQEEFWGIKALINYETVSVAEALKDINYALQVNPSKGSFWILKAGILEALGQPIEAISCLDHAAELGIEKEEILLLKAKAYRIAGNHLMCKLTIETLLSEPLEFEETFIDLFLELEALSDTQFAIRVFENYTQIDANTQLSWHFLGDCYSLESNIEPAIHAYSKALALDPTFESSYIAKGMIYVENKDYQKALEIFKLMLESCGQSNSTYFLIAECYRKNGQQTLARKYFNQSLKIDPSFAMAWNALGYSYLATHDDEKAIGCLKKSVKLSPTDVFLRHEYAQVLTDLEHFEEAKIVVTKGIEIDDSYAPFHSLLATVYFETGNKKEAIHYLSDWNVKNSQDAYMHYKLAAYLFAIGDVDGCLHEAQLGLELNEQLHRAIFESYAPTENYKPLRDLIDLYRFDSPN